MVLNSPWGKIKAGSNLFMHQTGQEHPDNILFTANDSILLKHEINSPSCEAGRPGTGTGKQLVASAALFVICCVSCRLRNAITDSLLEVRAAMEKGFSI